MLPAQNYHQNDQTHRQIFGFWFPLHEEKFNSPGEIYGGKIWKVLVSQVLRIIATLEFSEVRGKEEEIAQNETIFPLRALSTQGWYDNDE